MHSRETFLRLLGGSGLESPRDSSGLVGGVPCTISISHWDQGFHTQEAKVKTMGFMVHLIPVSGQVRSHILHHLRSGMSQLWRAQSLLLCT